MNLYDHEEGGFDEDAITLHNEECRRRYEHAEPLIYNEFKEWLQTDPFVDTYGNTKGCEYFNEGMLFGFVKIKSTPPDYAVVWKTLDGWFEFGCISKSDEGYKFLL